MPLKPAEIARFERDMEALASPASRLGIAVSGGPDSLALLLLAAAARPGAVEAATVDHSLREGSRDEAMAVAAICAQIEVPHAILAAEWDDKPATAIQEQARLERYRLLARWAHTRRLDAIVTGHHADDQAETLLMRLNRGAGVRGLAGMRARSIVPGSTLPLLRPLLTWRRSELEQVCADAGVQPFTDPSNRDERFERVRIRNALSTVDWLDDSALAASASNLADADDALDWAAEREWRNAVRTEGVGIRYTPGDSPTEIVRRVVARAIASLAVEGAFEPLRARELDPLISTLRNGGRATLRGLVCSGGSDWRFAPAPPRKPGPTS